jgi:hypothetical protein
LGVYLGLLQHGVGHAVANANAHEVDVVLALAFLVHLANVPRDGRDKMACMRSVTLETGIAHCSTQAKTRQVTPDWTHDHFQREKKALIRWTNHWAVEGQTRNELASLLVDARARESSPHTHTHWERAKQQQPPPKQYNTCVRLAKDVEVVVPDVGVGVKELLQEGVHLRRNVPFASLVRRACKQAFPLGHFSLL